MNRFLKNAFLCITLAMVITPAYSKSGEFVCNSHVESLNKEISKLEADNSTYYYLSGIIVKGGSICVAANPSSKIKFSGKVACGSSSYIDRSVDSLSKELDADLDISGMVLGHGRLCLTLNGRI